MKKLSLLSVLFFIGCSQSLPKCSDTEATDLVRKIIAETYGMEYALGFKKYDPTNEDELRTKEYMDSIYGPKTRLTIGSIRTTETDGKRGAYTCSARYELSGTNDMDRTRPITYTIELMDNGDEFIVNVYGL